MKYYKGIISNDWMPNITTHGEANGYVFVTKESKLYEKDYNGIPPISIHGGLTFSNYATYLMCDIEWIGEAPTDISELWAIGFDTNHHGDNPVSWSKKKVIKETLELEKQLKNVEQSWN